MGTTSEWPPPATEERRRRANPSLGALDPVVTHRFRTLPPYRPEEQAWLQNIVRTALLHLRQRRTTGRSGHC
ncbi:hypothetical protein [Streptomyces sp. NPDC060035]|uniref:hypothetical protein n=1 Tax=Streptomyces sp. NPDC060035 TaxID=3347044 RepID=UPI0036CA8C70